MKGVGITSSMWRCGTSCAWIWNNCTSSSTSPSVVYARSRTWFKPSLLKLDWSLRKLDRVCAPVSNSCSQVRDLTLLKGMPLTLLNLGRCDQVRDLTPLKGMPLTYLNLQWCGQVRDLTPLNGMPLTTLSLQECSSVSDLILNDF